jgi:antitoxin component YwqK of YwqJK toxin-antitoxin module
MNKITIVSFVIYIASIHAFGVESKCDTIMKKPFILLSCSTWFNNGNLESVYNQKNGKFEGLYKSWYKNGQVENSFNYVNGCLSDTSFSFFENGHIQLIAKNSGCNRRGWSISFFENGDTVSISTPQSFKSFYKTHKIRTKQFFNENNKKHGLCESWREDGTRKDSTVFKDGNTIEAREYYLTGKPRYWERYKGVEVTTIEKFPDGSTLDNVHNPIIEGTYYDLKTGKILTKIINGNGKAIYFAEDGTNPDTCIIQNGARVRKKQ